MKKILIIYYSQSGQLKKIADNLVKPIENLNGIDIIWEEIKPVNDYPFPWGKEFFDCFPESVKGIPCELRPFNFDPDLNPDLVILAYQPWFLSPSIPISSFLQTREAASLLKGKKVITLLGCRNMWAASEEIIKTRLYSLEADLIGNIVLADKANNYISCITIIRWMIYGNKSSSWILPEAGVSAEDIENCTVFGEIIGTAITGSQFENLQKKLVQAGAVKVVYHLVSIEFTARKIFNKFADYVLNKGNAGDVSRNTRIRLFKWYLFIVFFIVSPVVSFFYIIKGFLLFRIKRKITLYYEDVRR
jgi:hypothetical protein